MTQISIPKTKQEMNKYGSFFRGFYWTRLDPLRVRVWNTCRCDDCGEEGPTLILHDLVLYESVDAHLDMSGLTRRPEMEEGMERIKVPYGGGPKFCLKHYRSWLTGIPIAEQELTGSTV